MGGKENKKEKKSKVFYIVDTILLITLIIVVIFAQIKGTYIDKQIKVVEVCQGQPTLNGLKTLEELGWKPQNQTTIPNNSNNK